MKKLAVNKSKVDSTIRELTKRMHEINLFVNIQTKPHKDSDKVWIIVGQIRAANNRPQVKTGKGNPKHQKGNKK